jgi:short-subunit dehydrogenase
MCFSLKDKVVVITGASTGIGAELARICVKEGGRVSLAARSEDKLIALKKDLEGQGGEVLIFKADVVKTNDRDQLIHRTLDKWGRIDVLVNNAGYGVSGSLEESSMDVIRNNFETNVFSAVALMQMTIPYLKKNQGMIVNIESIVALRSMPTSSSYSATKHALHAFSEAARLELKDDGVHVLSVCPGLIETEFHRNRVQVGNRSDMGPSWLFMPVEKCANQIVRAMKSRKRQIVVTGHAKLLALLQRLSPGFLDMVLRERERKRRGK